MEEGYGSVNFLSWTTDVCAQNLEPQIRKDFFFCPLRAFWLIKDSAGANTVQCETQHFSWVCRCNGGDLTLAAAQDGQLRRGAKRPWTQVINVPNHVVCKTMLTVQKQLRRALNACPQSVTVRDMQGLDKVTGKLWNVLYCKYESSYIYIPKILIYVPYGWLSII